MLINGIWYNGKRNTIFAVFGRGEKLELVSKKSEDEMNISAGLAKKEKKLQA